MINKPYCYGNSAMQPSADMHGGINPHIPLLVPRRLVEECASVSIADLRHVFGKKTLLSAANDASPIKFQLGGHGFEIYVLTEQHHLPKTNRQTCDDSLVRIWLVCLGCRSRARKLFTFPLAAGTNALADLRCRRCHHLTYMSVNCSGNQWWLETDHLRRMLRRRKKLLAMKQTERMIAELEEIDRTIWIWRQRGIFRSRSCRRRVETEPIRSKRSYRNIALLMRSYNLDIDERFIGL